MTKKHFEAAARIVRARHLNDAGEPIHKGHPEVQERATEAAETMYYGFVALFRKFNPRFDTTRFRRACGLEGV